MDQWTSSSYLHILHWCTTVQGWIKCVCFCWSWVFSSGDCTVISSVQTSSSEPSRYCYSYHISTFCLASASSLLPWPLPQSALNKLPCLHHWIHQRSVVFSCIKMDRYSEERVKYKLATMVYNCLHGKAPSYVTDCCTPISDVASRRHLRSASRRRQSSSTTPPSTQSLHIWSSGFFCRRSGCLELPEWRTAWTVVNCEQFQTVT